jgi:O-antigen ligase
MPLIKQEIGWKYIESLRRLLYSGFFFFMPFTQALTFNVGFPLKFSELILFILSFLYIVFNRRVQMPRRLFIILSALFVVITISVCLNLFWDYPYPLREYETRFGYTGDSITRYVYFVLALLSFFISLDIFLQDRERYIKIWLYGAIVAAAYSCYLCIFSFLGLPVFLLPGMGADIQVISAFGRLIIRCGTFLEGNMMGLYLILSASLAFYSKRFKIGIFLLISTFTTFSTLSIISVFLFLVIYFQKSLLQKKYISYALPGLMILALLILLFSQTAIYKNYVYSKIFANTSKVSDPLAYSKADRLIGIQDAYRMALANPVSGVGLANYSRHYEQYMYVGTIDPEFAKKMLRRGEKVIPNNIYLEVWAESGGLTLLLFLALLGLLLYYSRFDSTKTLFPALLCMLLCFTAYPSFIMLYLWAFLALPAADYILLKKNTESNKP